MRCLGVIGIGVICALATMPVHAQQVKDDLLSADVLQAVDPNEVYGHVRSRNKAILSSQFPAKIDAIPFRDGEVFKKGDVLVRLDCALLKAEEAKIIAILGGANKKLAVEKRLVKLQSGGRLDMDLAAAKVAEGRAELRGIRTKLSKCKLKAPYAGRVVQQRAGEHEFVQTGAPILEVVEDGQLEVEFIVPSKWVGKLQTGTMFQIRVTETQISYPAKVVRRGAVVDPISRTITMIGHIQGKHPELISGMSGVVSLDLSVAP